MFAFLAAHISKYMIYLWCNNYLAHPCREIFKKELNLFYFVQEILCHISINIKSVSRTGGETSPSVSSSLLEAHQPNPVSRAAMQIWWRGLNSTLCQVSVNHSVMGLVSKNLWLKWFTCTATCWMKQKVWLWPVVLFKTSYLFLFNVMKMFLYCTYWTSLFIILTHLLSLIFSGIFIDVVLRHQTHWTFWFLAKWFGEK